MAVRLVELFRASEQGGTMTMGFIIVKYRMPQ